MFPLEGNLPCAELRVKSWWIHCFVKSRSMREANPALGFSQIHPAFALTLISKEQSSQEGSYLFYFGLGLECLWWASSKAALAPTAVQITMSCSLKLGSVCLVCQAFVALKILALGSRAPLSPSQSEKFSNSENPDPNSCRHKPAQLYRHRQGNTSCRHWFALIRIFACRGNASIYTSEDPRWLVSTYSDIYHCEIGVHRAVLSQDLAFHAAVHFPACSSLINQLQGWTTAPSRWEDSQPSDCVTARTAAHHLVRMNCQHSLGFLWLFWWPLC